MIATLDILLILVADHHPGGWVELNQSMIHDGRGADARVVDSVGRVILTAWGETGAVAVMKLKSDMEDRTGDHA